MIIDTKEFENIRKELAHFEQDREKQIQQARKIITLSKRIIYCVHRDDLKDARVLAKEIQKEIKSLSAKDLDTGMDKVALQEYVEAICFLTYIDKGYLPTKTEIKVSTNIYLLGLCDLTGELGRKAVKCVIKKDFDQTEKIRQLVEEIFGEFLKLDLRNGELRKKSDAIKWNLHKIEDLVYDIKVKDKRT